MNRDLKFLQVTLDSEVVTALLGEERDLALTMNLMLYGSYRLIGLYRFDDTLACFIARCLSVCLLCCVTTELQRALMDSHKCSLKFQETGEKM